METEQMRLKLVLQYGMSVFEGEAEPVVQQCCPELFEKFFIHFFARLNDMERKEKREK